MAEIALSTTDIDATLRAMQDYLRHVFARRTGIKPTATFDMLSIEICSGADPHRLASEMNDAPFPGYAKCTVGAAVTTEGHVVLMLLQEHLTSEQERWLAAHPAVAGITSPQKNERGEQGVTLRHGVLCVYVT